MSDPIQARDVVGGVHSDSHNVHTTTTNDYSTHYVHEAQKTEQQLTQDNRKQFIQAIEKAVMEPDGLTRQKLGMLQNLAMQLVLDPQEAEQLIKSVSANARMQQQGAGLDFVAQQTVNQTLEAIAANNVRALMSLSQTLKQLAETSADDSVQYCYHLCRATFNPDAALTACQSTKVDSYWLLYWGYVAAVLKGDNNMAAQLLPCLGQFGYPQGDLSLLLAISNLATYRRDLKRDIYYMQQAQNYLFQASDAGLSSLLEPVWYALKDCMMEQSSPEPWFAFYVDNTLKVIASAKLPPLPGIGIGLNSMPQTLPPSILQVPPIKVPQFDAQSVNLSQMQGFNPLQAAQQLGLGVNSLSDLNKK